MKKIYNSITIIMIIMSLLCIYSIRVKATDNTYEVSTQEEFINALADIHNNSNGTFVININDDFTIDNTYISSSNRISNIDNGNTVTIKSSGHTITFSLSQYDKLKVSDGATLNLYSSNGSDTLTLKGPGDGNTSYNSLVSVDSNGIVNMYDGITLSDNCSGTTSLTAGGVRINANGTFNMYGGTIKDNKIQASELGGAVVADGVNSKFYMYGGTIENNQSVTWGGGITINEPTALINITGGTIKGNHATYGGGILIGDGTATISNATIDGNSATVGGGILNYVTATISNCQIINNTAVRAAGIANRDDQDPSTNYTLTLSNNVIKNNVCTERGGGIYSEIPIISSEDIITENQARDGGGVYLKSGTADLENSKVYNNKATNSGNDYVITSAITELKVMPAANINELATYDSETTSTENWYTDESSTRYSLDNPTTVVPTISAGTDYYLTAAGPIAREVIFETNGGSTIQKMIVAKDSTITKPSDPTKTNYTFKGWYKDSLFNTIFDFEEPITDNITIYARWEENEPEPDPDDNTIAPDNTIPDLGDNNTVTNNTIENNATADDENNTTSGTTTNDDTNSTDSKTNVINTGDEGIIVWASILIISYLLTRYIYNVKNPSIIKSRYKKRK